MSLRRILLLLTTFICSGVSIQAISQNFETIGVNEGLSQSSVYALLQDRKGFIWIGTADGLNRYDGEKISVFKFRNAGFGRPNSNVVRGKICEDGHGRIWFA